MDVQEFLISTQLANELLSYLGERPYKEAAGLIIGLQSAYREQAQQLAKPPAPSQAVENNKPTEKK